LFWFENMFDCLYLFKEKLNIRYNLKPITQNFEFKDDKIVLKAFLNQHLFSNREFILEENLPNKMESYCFVIEIDNMKIVYTGDITDKNDIEDLIERSDFLICESTHIEVEELLALIGRKKVKSTILAHIPEEVERKKDWINKRAKDFNCENLIFAFDGLNIDIP